MLGFIVPSRNRITKINSSIRFFHYVIFKWLFILFKRNRVLKEIKFNHYKNWHFKTAYLTVQFEFENAIWINVEGSKRICSHLPIIINLENFEKDFFEIIIHGFRSKRKYQIAINTEAQIDNATFKTATYQIKNIYLQDQIIQKNIPKAELISHYIQVKAYQINTSYQKSELKYSNFKLQDYL